MRYFVKVRDSERASHRWGPYTYEEAVELRAEWAAHWGAPGGFVIVESR